MWLRIWPGKQSAAHLLASARARRLSIFASTSCCWTHVEATSEIDCWRARIDATSLCLNGRPTRSRSMAGSLNWFAELSLPPTGPSSWRAQSLTRRGCRSAMAFNFIMLTHNDRPARRYLCASAEPNFDRRATSFGLIHISASRASARQRALLNWPTMSGCWIKVSNSLTAPRSSKPLLEWQASKTGS